LWTYAYCPVHNFQAQIETSTHPHNQSWELKQ
jgi:hypothetical protein